MERWFVFPIRLDSAQAEAEQQNALGALAVRMDLSAGTPLRLASPGPAAKTCLPPGSASSLFAEARQYHPALRNDELESTPLASYDSTRQVAVQLTITLYKGQARRAKVSAAEAEYNARRAPEAGRGGGADRHVGRRKSAIEAARRRAVRKCA